MNCCEAEDLLVDLADLTIEQASRLDAHLRQCDWCQVFRDTLEEVDSELARVLSAEPARPLNLSVMGQGSVQRPSIISGFLDVAGTFGVIACAAALLAAFIPTLEPTIPLTFWFGALLFLSGLCAVFRLSQSSDSPNH